MRFYTTRLQKAMVFSVGGLVAGAFFGLFVLARFVRAETAEGVFFLIAGAGWLIGWFGPLPRDK